MVEPVADKTRATCHKCRSRNLSLSEMTECFASYADIHLDPATDRLYSTEDANLTTGDIISRRTRLHCHDCGHNWHPKRTFDGVR